MGAWSHEPFGNDTASDWKYGLEEATDLSLIEETFDRVLAIGEDYLESPEAEEAVAAAEVLARLVGPNNGAVEPVELVDAWAANIKLKPSDELIQKAQAALNRILSEDSELLELWQESGSYDAWAGSMNSLMDRLSV